MRVSRIASVLTAGLLVTGLTLIAAPAQAATVSDVIDGVTYTADNTNVTAGATNPTLKLGKAQAGRTITVTITASSPGYVPVAATSAPTANVSSPYARIVLTTNTVKKGASFGLVATGLKANQKYKIWLGGKNNYTGKANANGTVARTVNFASSIKPGTRRVRVSGYNSKGKRTFTVLTHVTYTK